MVDNRSKTSKKLIFNFPFCEPPTLTGNDERGSVDDRRIQSFLHLRFAVGVERRSCFVEDQNHRLFDQRARDCDSLPLTARKLRSAFADVRLVLVGQRFDEVVRLRLLGRFQNLLGRCALPSVPDVLLDGAAEEDRLLVDVPDDFVAQPKRRNLPQVDAVDENLSAGRFVKSFKKRRNGGLAGPAGADQRDGLSLFQRQVEVLQHGMVGTRWVSEADALEADLALELLVGDDGAENEVDLRLHRQIFEDARAGRHSPDHAAHDDRALRQRPLNGLRRHQEGHQLTGSDGVARHQVPAKIKRAQHHAVEEHVGEGLEEGDAGPQLLGQPRGLRDLPLEEHQLHVLCGAAAHRPDVAQRLLTNVRRLLRLRLRSPAEIAQGLAQERSEEDGGGDGNQGDRRQLRGDDEQRNRPSDELRNRPQALRDRLLERRLEVLDVGCEAIHEFAGAVRVEEFDVLDEDLLEEIASDVARHLLADSTQQEDVDEGEG